MDLEDAEILARYHSTYGLSTGTVTIQDVNFHLDLEKRLTGDSLNRRRIRENFEINLVARVSH
jgi:hypothetical protein